MSNLLGLDNETLNNDLSLVGQAIFTIILSFVATVTGSPMATLHNCIADSDINTISFKSLSDIFVGAIK